MKPGRTGISRILHAALYSWQGLTAAVRHEAAFRQELALVLVLIPVAFWLGRDVMEYIVLIASLFVVLIAELLNSGIEAIVDRVGSEPHELSGRAKDMGSAAVLISLLLVALVWGLILFDRFSGMM